MAPCHCQCVTRNNSEGAAGDTRRDRPGTCHSVQQNNYFSIAPWFMDPPLPPSSSSSPVPPSPPSLFTRPSYPWPLPLPWDGPGCRVCVIQGSESWLFGTGISKPPDIERRRLQPLLHFEPAAAAAAAAAAANAVAADSARGQNLRRQRRRLS
jgi:hypothetical protein